MFEGSAKGFPVGVLYGIYKGGGVGFAAFSLPDSWIAVGRGKHRCVEALQDLKTWVISLFLDASCHENKSAEGFGGLGR